jgi:urease accessory protein
VPLTLTDATGDMVAANRARSRVSLTVADHQGAARPGRLAEEGSLRLRFPAACAGAQEAVLINTAGGVAGGDRLTIDLRLEERARLVVTTASAEKIYRSESAPASLAVAASLAEGAELTWLPHETILFDRARLVRSFDIDLAPTARLLFAEAVVLGRTAMGETVREGLLADRWRVRRGARLIFAESFRLDGAIADRLAETAVAAGHVALATVLAVPGDDAVAEAVRAMTSAFRGETGISAWNGMALARLAAPDGAALRHDLALLLTALGGAPLPRLWLN